MVIDYSLLWFFIFYERRKANPILNPKLLTKNLTFLAANLTAFLNCVSTFASVFVFSNNFTVLASLRPSEASLILTVEPVMMVIFSPGSAKLSDRFGSRILASAGMLLISAGFFKIYYLVERFHPIEFIWPLVVVGMGFGVFPHPTQIL